MGINNKSYDVAKTEIKNDIREPSDKSKECTSVYMKKDDDEEEEVIDDILERVKGDNNNNGTTTQVNVQDGNVLEDKNMHGIKIFGYPFYKIKWRNVIWLAFCHVLGAIGYWYAIVYGIKALTITWTFLLAAGSAFGLACGAHRLWSHRSFKAHWLLELFLMILDTISMTGSVYSYARDHRTHHKNSDTPADPKNSFRGFWYSQMGWWLFKKDPIVIQRGSLLNYDDLLDNKLIAFQHKFYQPMLIFWGILFPAAVPYLLWNENLYNSFLTVVFLRYVIVLHHFWTTNSLAHLYGRRVYDKSLRPAESRLVNYLSLGEGHHNFHHTFPWDYVTSQEGWKWNFDPATLFLDSCKNLGLVYEEKRAPKHMIKNRIHRTGCPEEFTEIDKRSKLVRIVISVLDWIAGHLVALWALWLGITLKCVYLAFRGELSVYNVLKEAFYE